MPYNSTDSFGGHRQQTPAVWASSPPSSAFVSQQLPLVCPQTFCRDAFTQALTWGHTSFSYSQISILLCHRDASFLNKMFRERDLPVCSWEKTVIYFCKLGVHTGCTDILWLNIPTWKECKETASPKSPIPSMYSLCSLQVTNAPSKPSGRAKGACPLAGSSAGSCTPCQARRHRTWPHCSPTRPDTAGLGSEWLCPTPLRLFDIPWITAAGLGEDEL